MPSEPAERLVEGATAGLAVFDLDGTLTWRDTLRPFLLGYLRRRPARILRLWRAPAYLLAYLLGGADRGALKARLIRMVLGGRSRPEIDRWADEFTASLAARGAFRPAALACLRRHRDAGDRLVLLSASPDLYVPRIGASLGFDETICTGVRWSGEQLDGSLSTANRRGEEKVRCLVALRQRHPGLRVTAYGNSGSDLPHLRLAERGVLVNASHRARASARSLGVAVGEFEDFGA